MSSSHPERAAAQTQAHVDFDPTVYAPSLDAYVPADQIGPDGVPLPISEDVASEIRRIIEEDLEVNPEARRIWNEAERVLRERERGVA
ncbi:MAG: hypothetical protein ACYC6T_08210 [Thermoleophilia bacterium]